MQTISLFAKDVGNRRPIIGKHEETKIVKQFLCTLVPQVSFQKVFAHVAPGQLSRIEFRAPNQLKKWQECKELTPKDLSVILKDSDPKHVFKSTIVGKHFIETTEPPYEKELVAFFIAGQADKNMHVLIDAELSHDETTDMFGTLKAYNIRDCGLSDVEIHEELGTIINALVFPFLDAETITILDQDKEEDEDVEERKVKEVKERSVEPKFKAQDHNQEWTAQHERELRSNPIIMAFKKENGLSTQFPSLKAAKQLVASTVTTCPNVPAEILGKRQTKITPLTVDPAKHTFEHWSQVVGALVDYHVSAKDRAEFVTVHDAAKDYYSFKKYKDDSVTETQFLKNMILEHVPASNDDTEKCEKYLQKYDQGMLEINKLLF